MGCGTETSFVITSLVTVSGLQMDKLSHCCDGEVVFCLSKGEGSSVSCSLAWRAPLWADEAGRLVFLLLDDVKVRGEDAILAVRPCRAGFPG